MHYFIDFIITKKCNLNCKYCTSRASICTTDYEYSLDQFRKDIDHLIDIGMNFTPVIIGGEPFCNKNIFDYIEYIRSKNKELPIAIFTNGKYLVTADDKIYDKLHALKVSLWITIYNLSNIEYNTVFNRCTKHLVPYRLNHYNESTTKFNKPLVRNKMGIYKLCEDTISSDNRLRKCMQYDTDRKPVCIRIFNGIMYYGACLPMLTDIDKKFNTHFATKLIENEDYTYVKNIVKPELSVETIKFCKKHCMHCGESAWTQSDKKREEFIYES